MNLHQVIISPITTEKTVGLQEKKKHAFYVHQKANKFDVKKAFKEFWGVEVVDVCVLKTPEKTRLVGRGKPRTKRAEKKKVYVQFKEDNFDILKFAGAKKEAKVVKKAATPAKKKAAPKAKKELKK